MVHELLNEGTDRIIASASYTIAGSAHVESMKTILSGATTAINLTGNEFGQYLFGNDGANVINGKGGRDTLTGIQGDDTFVFDSALTSANADWILDFNVVDDIIHLDNSVFTGLVAGALGAAAFHIGVAGADALERIIYNSDTGTLLFDGDGNGAGQAPKFASLSENLDLTSSDFFVV
jgi:Ca2+-binding RTX toxin-like protein